MTAKWKQQLEEVIARAYADWGVKGARSWEACYENAMGLHTERLTGERGDGLAAAVIEALQPEWVGYTTDGRLSSVFALHVLDPESDTSSSPSSNV